MTMNNTSEAAKAVVRRNTEEVQGGGNFEVFDELFADDFLDHTPQPGRTPDKDGARQLYKILRTAFPDFHAEIHWQLADGVAAVFYCRMSMRRVRRQWRSARRPRPTSVSPAAGIAAENSPPRRSGPR
jgi:SnoaL-like polyketide cyclase